MIQGEDCLSVSSALLQLRLTELAYIARSQLTKQIQTLMPRLSDPNLPEEKKAAVRQMIMSVKSKMSSLQSAADSKPTPQRPHVVTFCFSCLWQVSVLTMGLDAFVSCSIE